MTVRHVAIVSSFDELTATPFAGDINALCWPRELPGDFQEIVGLLHVDEGITSIDDDDLGALALSPAGALARDVLLTDLALMRARGLQPSLDCIRGYTRDATDAVVARDVHSFHVDSSPVPADTYLCTYVGAPSEGLANADAIRRIDEPETRKKLLARYGGQEGDGFEEYLRKNCFDLHYGQRPGAVPYRFGRGNLWRIAIAHPNALTAPCIHRAPLTGPNDPPRLLLIS